MKLVFPKGTTSRIVTVFIQANNVTTGAGLSGLTNASSIVGGYVREGGTGVALAVDEDVTTEGTYQAPSAAGKVRIGTPANMRAGTYELHFHNDLWATGAEGVVITLGGATNMADIAIEVQLSDPVRGLGAPTALPNAAAEAAGGLFTRGTGAGQINQAANGMVDTNPVRLNNVSQSLLDLKDFADDGYDPSTNKVQGVVLTDTVTTYTGNTVQTGDAFARLGAPAGASVSADILAVDNLVDDLESRIGTPSNLGGGATVAANLADIEAQTDDIGAAGAGLTALATAASLATAQADLDTITGSDGVTLATTQSLYAPAKAGNQMDLVNAPNATAVTAIQNGLATPTNITAGTITTVTNLTNAPTNGDLTATMKTSVTTAATAATPVAASVAGNVAGNVTGSVGSLAAQAKADVNAEVVDVIDTDTSAEVTAPPAATSGLRARVAWLFKLARNKRTQTATTETVFADDTTTANATSTKSDDGTTLTRGEWS